MRKAAACAALALLVVSCARVEDASSDRVIGSPRPGDVEVTVTPGPPEAPSPTADPGAADPGAADPGAAGPGEPAAPPDHVPNLAAASVRLTRLANFQQPLAMAHRAGDPNLYVAEKVGRVRTFRDGTVGPAVLDISGEVSGGSEQGLLGLAFYPDGRWLYVNFTNRAGNTIVREYDFSQGTARSPRNVLEIAQPFANHNGGGIKFGPDGYLYIGTGDGGSAGDPQNNAQNLSSLLGKMLRIEPRPVGQASYRVPGDNPFVGRGGRDEIWAYGLRNPWRFSFDAHNRDLWIADVGQNAWEEVNHQPAASAGGENYGWNRMEGTRPFRGGTPPADHKPPVYEYANAGGNCSVTGGYVYRGARIPDLQGSYVFADYCVGRLRAFSFDGAGARGHRFLGPQAAQVASFGEDPAGELYVLSLSGGLYRIEPG